MIDPALGGVSLRMEMMVKDAEQALVIEHLNFDYLELVGEELPEARLH